MSYAAFKMMHPPTGIENCASGFITHSNQDLAPKIPSIHTDDLDADWPIIKPIGSIPNLVVTAGNVLEVYVLRLQEESSGKGTIEAKRGGVMAGISGASLELVCHYRLHGNVDSMAILSGGSGNGKRRDSIILTFEDAKISVLEFDESVHGLRTSSMHCFEGPEWLYLKRGRESFAEGPVVKVDPQGRCAGVLVYGLEMIILKASEAGGFVGDGSAHGSVGAGSARIESSYIISLRDLDMKHVKDFVFINGYIEPVLVILHEHELTWAGRVSWKHHTCGISALSISTSLKQHPLIWSASNLPHEAYKLLAVPSPIGGVIIISANTIHYHSQSASCLLALNNFAVSVDSSQEMTRSNFSLELDAANATWLSNDVAMLSTKTGELLLLKLVYDGRVVQRLDLSKSKASVLTSGITTIGNSLFFLGSRLGDSLLVQFTSGVGASNLPPGVKEEGGDIEGDVHLAKRLRRSSSDALQDMVNGDELNLYSSGPINAESTQGSKNVPALHLFKIKKLKRTWQQLLLEVLISFPFFHDNTFLIRILFQSLKHKINENNCIDLLENTLIKLADTTIIFNKTFSFTVRDSLINVGPLKDFSYGLRINADHNATGISKQSNYELVCCSGHGKNGALCVLQRSIRPEVITQEPIPGCRGLWTVYHKNSRSHSIDSSKTTSDDDDEYHAYLIISLESRTMVLQTVNNLEEVTENVDYYVQGSTIAVGNLFGRRRVIQVYARGARILDGAFMTQELNFKASNSESSSGSETSTVISVSIADPYVLVRMTDGSVQLIVGDPSTCTVSTSFPGIFENSKKSIASCTLYHDKGPEPWLRKTSTDAWLSSGIGEAIDGSDSALDQGDVYCVVCYENGILEIYDVPNFSCVFSVDNFESGKTYLGDTFTRESSTDAHKLTRENSEETNNIRKENSQKIKVVELAMHRWSGQHSRPFLFGILTDGTVLCYHAYLFEGSESSSKVEGLPVHESVNLSNTSASRLKNLRFVRVPLDTYIKEEISPETPYPRITTFKNVGGFPGLFLAGSRPVWFMIFRERLRIHPQLCDGPIVAFTILHNVYCNHGIIYLTSEGTLKICQLPSLLCYDNHWPVQKIPLKGTPHQVTYFAEKNLYPLIVSVPVLKPLNQVLSSLVDQEGGHQLEHDNFISDGTYAVEEFEIRILEPEKSGGPWQIRGTVPMQSSENALTVRVVTLFNTTTRENETLLAVGTAYVQGEDVAGRGRVLLFSVERNPENSQTVISEVFSKELKGAISAVASLQGHLLIASGPKVILHKWTGSDLTGVAFYDAPPLYVVSLNIVKNFILLGDIHKSIYFLSWKEQGAQLTLLAKDFGSLDCFATEFLIDGSTLSLIVSDDQKNVQIFYYAPKMSESWKGQKLLSRAEFHVGAHVTKFLRLQMLPTPDRTNAAPVPDKTNRFALLFGTLDGSIGCIAPVDELTFRRLQSLQKKLVDSVPHVAGLNPKSFRQFHSKGKAHRPGPDNIVDCELLCQFEMLLLEQQLEIANQIGTTRSQIMANLNDLALATSFL